MLTLRDKKNCCGCQACYEACPSKCISMASDEEGFLYPRINQADCVDCGLCERVCPQLNSEKREHPETPRSCYAAISKDLEIRLLSSSGGVFSLLADKILGQNGVVFGARFDEQFAVYHSYTESPEGLPPFRGSKYAQSDLRGVYSQVRQFLQANRPVLFSGTPCQIAGLRGFLGGKEYNQLFLVSVICHGAPSPLVWRDYLDHITGGPRPTGVNMRNKDNGWGPGDYRMVIQRGEEELMNTQATGTPYMRAFLTNLTLRPSCYSCHFRGNHGSDLTLGDYWGIEKIHPRMADNKGTSLILVYTDKGQRLMEGIDMRLEKSLYEDALRGNMAIIQPAYKPAERTMFWKSFQKRGARALTDYTANSRRARARRLWAKLLRRLRIG